MTSSSLFSQMRRRVRSITASFFSVALLATASSAWAATLADGMNASNVLGQANFSSPGAAPTQAGMSVPRGSAYDSASQRLFVADSGNNRVLIYNTSSGITDGMNAAFVLGQPNFSLNTPATNQGAMSGPRGVAFDSARQRLFVADTGNNRVLVYDLAGAVTNGMNAAFVLGQADFNANGGVTTQAGMNSPFSVAYDSPNQRLFVAERFSNRVTIFNVANITNGMNAAFVLGQADFNANGAAFTQTGMGQPFGVVYDAAGQRLFVADSAFNRVLIFDVAAVTNGEAAVNVLGQANFTANSAATSQSGMNAPHEPAYDPTTKRLFVPDAGNTRVLIFDVAAITNGEAAVNVLGQANFTSNGAATTQSGMNSPSGASIDTANQRLFVSDSSNNRVLVYDLTPSGGGGVSCPAPSITLARPNGAESFSYNASEPLFWSVGGCGVMGVRLTLSTDGGATYPTVIADNVYPGGGYYAWTVPDMNTASARIKAEVLGQGGALLASDASDADFSIVGTPPAASPEPAEPTSPQPITGDTPLQQEPTFTDTSTTSFPSGTNDPTPYSAEEKASPATDPNSAGSYSAANAEASTPTIDVDLGILPPPTEVKLPCIGGSLIKVAGNSAVYYCAKNGKRFVFPHFKIFYTWYKDFSSVKVISVEEMALVPIGGNITYKPGVKLVKIQTDPKTYAIARDGLLRWVPDEETAASLYGADWATKVDDVSDAFFFSYSIGIPIPSVK